MTKQATGRSAAVLVYGAGLVQGLALVTFPAASSVFTSPTGYDLSSTAYGLMFLPQVVLAIIAASMSPAWARRWSLRAVLFAGLAANLAAMTMLVISATVSSNLAVAYPLLLVATGALGFGFGSTVPALTTYAEQLVPDRQDRSVLTLNALLGLGTALAPLLVALFVGLGAWWLLPAGVALALMITMSLAVRIPLADGTSGVKTKATAAGRRARVLAGLTPRFAWYALALLLYGICETLFGNWSSLYLTGQRGLSVTVASLSLAAFWAAVTVGRVAVAVITARVSARTVYLLLPIVVAAGLLFVSGLHSDAAAVLAFTLGGLGCSAILPLSLSFAGQEFPRVATTASGELIASYQVGYGVTAFGVPLLQSLTGASLAAIYAAGAGIAAGLFATARMVIGRGRTAESIPTVALT